MRDAIDTRTRVAAAIARIRQALLQRQASRTDSKGADSFEIGIQLCSEMELLVSNRELPLKEASLFRRFDHYAIDSMPWDQELWSIVEEAHEEAKKCL